jgi:hypothetical protein
MFTLALLLALTVHQPPHVCIVGHAGPECDYTYNSLEQAVAEHPDAVFMIAPGAWVPLKPLIDDAHRQGQAMRRYLELYSIHLFFPNGCERPLSPDGCGQPPTLVQI